MTETWVGIDVGDCRNGFHLAAISNDRLTAGPVHATTVDDAVDWVSAQGPLLVAVDSPISAAPHGRTWREGERLVNRTVCGIRWTPDRRSLEANPAYYGWILHGFELYWSLSEIRIRAIECFPTASCTRWAGRRGSQTRAAWTRQALASLGLSGLPPRTNQHERDAVAAAATACEHSRGSTELFGDIVVPRVSSRRPPPRSSE